MRTLRRIVGPMLAVLLAISLQSPASAIPDQIPPEPRPDPSVTLARNAWATLGNRIEAGAAYAQVVDQSMACPVPGATFVSSWGAPRDGGARAHQGVDMMADFGTVILAPASGIFEGDGESFYLRADNGDTYFGTHNGGDLAPSGSRVVRGQPISTVSNTGNASGGAPHLHFEIHPGGGEPVDPYPATFEACSRPVAQLRGLPGGGTRTMPRVTADQIRFCRFTTAGIGVPFVACLHVGEGHHQGMPGHLWADYRRQARQFARFLSGFHRSCSGPADCPALIRAAFARQGIGWRGDEAVRVATCESGLNPGATNGSHDGLFQQSRAYWSGRASQYGFAGASAYDPWANAMVSAGMVRDTGGWSHWSCSP